MVPLWPDPAEGSFLCPRGASRCRGSLSGFRVSWGLLAPVRTRGCPGRSRSSNATLLLRGEASSQRAPKGGGLGRPRDPSRGGVTCRIMAAPSGRFPGRLIVLPFLGFCLAAGAGAQAAGGGAGLPEVCGGCCPGLVRNDSAVAAQCASLPGAQVRGRCCCEAAAVVGLDLGNCSLHQLCSSFQEASTALVIDLTDNPLEPLPEDALRGFTQLQTLALPLTLDCPGGNEGWDNVTIRGSSRICHGQRNPCNGSGGLGHLCPKDSLCAPDGPGLPQCLCISPHYGYKCLRQGTFPYLLFFGTLGAVTIALSLLLWVTQRRKTKVS